MTSNLADCNIGACHRHQHCMYVPCRAPKPVSAGLTPCVWGLEVADEWGGKWFPVRTPIYNDRADAEEDQQQIEYDLGWECRVVVLGYCPEPCWDVV